MADILIVDDHTLFRSGLRRLLSDEPHLRVAAEAADGAEALARLRENRFQLIILDINLGGRNGLDVLRALRKHDAEVPVLVMSMYPEEQFAQAAYQGGAQGYLSKDVTPDLLFQSIRRLLAGERDIRARPAAPPAPATDPRLPHYRLSAREMQIFGLIVAGHSLTDIGLSLFLSVKTVSTYRSRILEKLELRNNAELVQYAMRHGIGVV